MRKQAEAVGSATPDPVVGQAAVLPVPQVVIPNKPAPGQTGPRGMGPRQTYSRVNTGVPPTPDAGSMAQKTGPNLGAAPAPKLAEVPMTTTFARPDINSLLKHALDATISNAEIAAEAVRQASTSDDAEKTASANTDHVPTEMVEKLASALLFVADELQKTAEPGEGPGAITVTETNVSGTSLQPGQSGQATAANQPPKSPALQAEKVQGGNSGTGLETNDEMRHSAQPVEPIPNEKATLENEKSKSAAALANSNSVRVSALLNGAKPVAKEASAIVAAIRAKVAEDAINPAQISAGTAPDANTSPTGTSASGEGAVTVPSDVSSQASLIGSNEAAINFTKARAKADPKKDLGAVLNEPALSSSTDKVLNESFANTGAAGAKIAMQTDAVRAASARVVLGQLLSTTQGAAE